MLILSCLNFQVQSYDALEQETTISQFFVSFTCGGYMIFATDNEYFDIIVAVKAIKSYQICMRSAGAR